MREFKTTVPFPPYRYKVFVIFTDNLKGSADSLAKKGLLTKGHGIDDTSDGFHVLMSNQSYCFIVLRQFADINQISHEAYHAVSTMFRWIGAKHEEEIFAYHLGYLIEQIRADQQKMLKKLDLTLDKPKEV